MRLFFPIDHASARVVVFLLDMYLLLGAYLFFLQPQATAVISPVPEIPEVRTSTPTPLPTPEPVIGMASYYSRSGCIGCSTDFVMANGEVLDDTRLTVAYNDAPLNSFLIVRNIDTGMEVLVKVTDRGGYKKHGKIIDLSKAVKEVLGCGDVCRVSIERG